ncbi:hypothetical protein HKBW3S06_01101, partial [Candidatus Hakubella thermalkaliphila]
GYKVLWNPKSIVYHRHHGNYEEQILDEYLDFKPVVDYFDFRKTRVI